MRQRSMLWLAVGLMAAGMGVAQAAMPNLSNANIQQRILINEPFGTYAGIRTSVAINTVGEPHVVTDQGFTALGRTITVFHRKGPGSWLQENLDIVYPAASVAQPRIKVDQFNRVWIIAHYFTCCNLSLSGQGVWTIDNVLVNTTARFLDLQHYGPYGGWMDPRLALDPFRPGEAFVFTADGYYNTIDFTGRTTGGGQLGIGRSGEQHEYTIAPVAGQQGVLHGCQAGSNPNPASYNNSLRAAGPMVWASEGRYSMGGDEVHPGVAADEANPGTAYLACGWPEGLVMNIWNHQKGQLIRPLNALIMLDANANHLNRMPPSMASAKGGGVWVTWAAGTQVKLCYLDADGNQGEVINVAQGVFPNLAVDDNGDIHMVFTAGGNRYLKIQAGTGAGKYTVAGSFGGDQRHDLAVYDSQTGKWYVKSASGETLAWEFAWGLPGAAPVPADYGSGVKKPASMIDPAVYDPLAGKWYVKSLDGTVLAWEFAWGFPGALPVPADYNADGKADPAVYDPLAGKWYVKSLSGAVLAWEFAWGFPGAVPVAADYNNDGKADPAVYDPLAGKWYVKSLSGAVLAWEFAWGFPGAIPVVADYNGDGKADPAVYDPLAGKWYVKSLDGTVLAWDFAWGYTGAVAVPIDYNGDGKVDMGIYDPTTAKWYIKALNGTVLLWDSAWGFPGATVIGRRR